MRKYFIMKVFILTMIMQVFTGCETNNENEIEEDLMFTGKLTVEGKDYELKTLLFKENDGSTEFTFFNVKKDEIESSTLVKNDYLRLVASYRSNSSIASGIVYNEITRCELTLVDVNNGVVNSEEFLLYDSGGNNLDFLLESSELTVNSYSENIASLTFTFRRRDGVEITGFFEGELE